VLGRENARITKLQRPCAQDAAANGDRAGFRARAARALAHIHIFDMSQRARAPETGAFA
jgi:hypothetical protein